MKKSELEKLLQAALKRLDIEVPELEDADFESLLWEIECDDPEQEIRKLENLEAFQPSDYQKGALDMAAFLRGGGGTLSDKICMGGVPYVR